MQRACTLVIGLGLVMAFAGDALAGDVYRCTDLRGQVGFYTERKVGQKCICYKTFGGSCSRSLTKKDTPSALRPSRSSSFKPPPQGGSRALTERGSVRERMERYEAYVQEASETYTIPPDFIRAVMRVESSFRYDAVSSAGAQGLMQLMPKTGRSMGVNDPFDPRQNIFGGTKLLRVLANKYKGDMVQVLSAYNAGSGAVARKGGIPYQGTEGYVRAVLDHYYRYRSLTP